MKWKLITAFVGILFFRPPDYQKAKQLIFNSRGSLQKAKRHAGY